MDEKILEELGFAGNEIKVYIALLEMGTTSAGPLIKKVGMHRAAVYNILDILIDKGIVSYVIKANRKYFEAQTPLRLLEYVSEKREELEVKEQRLRIVIPELENIRKLSHEEQEGTIFKGKKGLRSVFEDILNEKRTWYVFGATGQFKQLFPAYFIHFHNKRVKLKINMKIIYSEKVKTEHRERDLKEVDIRYLHDSYITPSTTYIYGDKVVIIVWDYEPMAFVIRGKQVAQSYISFFELLWKIAKK